MELGLLERYDQVQSDQNVHESRKDALIVPWRKYTSMDPSTHHSIDNSRCTCGLCCEFSGSTSKTCWVFEKLGCNFSSSVRKYFDNWHSHRMGGSPIFNPETRV